MNALSLVLMIGAAITGDSSISGMVSNAQGVAVPGARVFLEQGVGGDVIEAVPDADGAFSFTGLEPGWVGVFAKADALAFGGLSLNVRVAERIDDVAITLEKSDSVAGRVTDSQGHPVPDAVIVPALFVGEAKVGIPLKKLAALGIEPSVSDDDGQFILSGMPRGGSLGLKVSHPLYAQEGVGDVKVGAQGIVVRLQSGIVVRGRALSRDGQVPVANATIIVVNSRPPRDTALVKTGRDGRFEVRLKPGRYLCQAASAEVRSAGWEQLDVTGTQIGQEVTVYVSGTAQVAGHVRDAVSGDPIAGVKLTLSAFGSLSSVSTTGPSGQYRMKAVEGPNVVRLTAAAGYQLPERSSVTVHAVQGQPVEVPTFWLAPIPPFEVEVVDEMMTPVPGAVVSLLRPRQYRWHVADDAGTVRFTVATMPADGIVGFAEHPTEAKGALFRVNRDEAADARVALVPLSSVTGRVTTPKNKGLGGAIVAAAFQDEDTADPLPLWQTVARDGGAFAWDNVPPMVPMVCVAYAGADMPGQSKPFRLPPDGEEDVGRIIVVDGKQAAGAFGDRLDLQSFVSLDGSSADGSAGAPVLVVFCKPEEGRAFLDALEAAQALFAEAGVACAMVVDGDMSASSDLVTLLRGRPPGPATTYLVGADGRVALETFGMPPLRAVRGIAGPAGS
ncbi:MAG: hypothetical protein GY851_26225 [bacterium]|nr:hypothetical protein [bacterium]